MAKKPTGQLYENRSKTTGKITSYGVRFRYAGKRRYVTLDATTRKEAETAAGHLLADVQRGLWTPPEERAPKREPREMPTFAEFASEWYRALCAEGGRDGHGLSRKGREDLLWRLGHLREFGPLRLDAITVEEVDRFRRRKVMRGGLAPSSINKFIETLSAILEVAVEYEHIPRNPAKGKRRRLNAAKPKRAYLDRAEHISALLDAAGDLDREERRRTEPWRRTLLAVLVFAGLRIGEALDLRWRDIDLASGTLHVHGTKTDAAERTVDLLPVLRDELLSYAAARPDRDPAALVFATSRAGRRYAGAAKHSPSNIRKRVLNPAIAAANKTLAKRGAPPMPEDLTPHGLRRTFASLLVALGRDPAVFMAQMGHTTANLTLSVYAKAMAWRDGERERLRALVEGGALREKSNTDPAETAHEVRGHLTA
jgi:integrase